MRHTREEVIKRAVREFTLLDELVANLTEEEWNRSLSRPEGKDSWTIKDALAHITYWKADVARSIRHERKSPEMRNPDVNVNNHIIYVRWHDRSPEVVLAWHRQTQEEVLVALREAPEEYFSGKERNPLWPFDLIGHSDDHRVKDIERALRRKAEL